jgi:NAD(P)-dependent dehydrogenase (short-subunit alcohol dehydrogenase family)
MDTPLLHQVALVTGSGKRLGREVALGLAERGADLVVHYRSSENDARKVTGEIEKLGRRAITVSADLDQVSQIRALFDKVAEAFGRLDILVNSAASFVQTEFAATTEKIWASSLDTNLKAPFFCSQAAAPLLKTTGGCIVNFADVGGILGWSGYIPHSISKAGVIMLTRCLAKELAPEVRVNAIAPGTITLPDDAPELEASFIRQAPLKRSGRPVDIVGAVTYLATAKFVTGQTLVVDGGRVL